MEPQNIQKLLEITKNGQQKTLEAVYNLAMLKLEEPNIERKQLVLDELAQFNSQETFDVIITAWDEYAPEQLAQIFQLLKLGGTFYVPANAMNMSFNLKVAGFLVEPVKGYLVAKKPVYEVGSAVKIDSKDVWSLPADDLGDEDLIDDEQLLDEKDKVKPTAESLRVCASTKQRKACANCSCGLKEELEQEEIANIRENSQNAKSSCGSCYLGDAFRCASCPYRGMPAFKPGEKVMIDTTSDI